MRAAGGLSHRWALHATCLFLDIGQLQTRKVASLGKDYLVAGCIGDRETAVAVGNEACSGRTMFFYGRIRFGTSIVVTAGYMVGPYDSKNAHRGRLRLWSNPLAGRLLWLDIFTSYVSCGGWQHVPAVVCRLTVECEVEFRARRNPGIISCFKRAICGHSKGYPNMACLMKLERSGPVSMHFSTAMVPAVEHVLPRHGEPYQLIRTTRTTAVS